MLACCREAESELEPSAEPCECSHVQFDSPQYPSADIRLFDERPPPIVGRRKAKQSSRRRRGSLQWHAWI